jgi:hypothetical protein
MLSSKKLISLYSLAKNILVKKIGTPTEIEKTFLQTHTKIRRGKIIKVTLSKSQLIYSTYIYMN